MLDNEPTESKPETAGKICSGEPPDYPWDQYLPIKRTVIIKYEEQFKKKKKKFTLSWSVSTTSFTTTDLMFSSAVREHVQLCYSFQMYHTYFLTDANDTRYFFHLCTILFNKHRREYMEHRRTQTSFGGKRGSWSDFDSSPSCFHSLWRNPCCRPAVRSPALGEGPWKLCICWRQALTASCTLTKYHLLPISSIRPALERVSSTFLFGFEIAICCMVNRCIG